MSPMPSSDWRSRCCSTTSRRWRIPATRGRIPASAAGRDRIIILVLDGAGWHTEPLAVPEGIRLVFLPPYTPELQPAETLWTHVDEPIVNKHFDTLADLDAVVAERCVALGNNRDLIRGQAGFHWWPKRTNPI